MRVRIRVGVRVISARTADGAADDSAVDGTKGTMILLVGSILFAPVSVGNNDGDVGTSKMEGMRVGDNVCPSGGAFTASVVGYGDGSSGR